MLSENNSIAADGIAKGILSAVKQVALQQLFLEKPPWPCLVTENDKGINWQQLQQQKGEAALTVSLCHPVTEQAIDGSSVTAMQRDFLLDVNQCLGVGAAISGGMALEK